MHIGLDVGGTKILAGVIADDGSVADVVRSLVAGALVLGVHDVSTGGLGLALGEMAIAGGVGFKAARVADHLSQDIEVAGSIVRSPASIGVAWSSSVDTTPEDLIRAADSAMYEAKRSRTGRPVLAGVAA